MSEKSMDTLIPNESGKITSIGGTLRCRQKFADVGLVEGAEIQMVGRAPFGGLLRLKVMGACMSLHSSDAHNFTVQVEG